VQKNKIQWTGEDVNLPQLIKDVNQMYDKLKKMDYEEKEIDKWIAHVQNMMNELA